MKQVIGKERTLQGTEVLDNHTEHIVFKSFVSWQAAVTAIAFWP